MKCVCEENRFCKYCYSILYYKINREEILEQQKIKKKKKKLENIKSK